MSVNVWGFRGVLGAAVLWQRYDASNLGNFNFVTDFFFSPGTPGEKTKYRAARTLP